MLKTVERLNIIVETLFSGFFDKQKDPNDSIYLKYQYSNTKNVI